MENKVIYDPTRRGFKERVFHALLFEIIAILITAPLFAFIMGQPITKMGILTIMFASIAMVCNVIFNFLFDLAQRRLCFKRTVKVRCIHAVLFEISLVAALVPIAAWWLSIGLVAAFLLDFCFTLFFLPYTFIFNWIYDFLRAKLFLKRARVV